MSDYSVDRNSGVNTFPALLGGLNIIVLIQIGLSSMTVGVGFWDFLFVLAGGYFAVKTVRYMTRAHESKKTKIRTQELESFPKKGIYSKIRHPVGAAFIYLNIACVLLFRSYALITVAFVFGAMWFILAKYQDDLLIKRFGEEYKEHIERVGMFRGKGDTSQRLQDSGYSMY
ncbi:MAG: methyltransferase family protein [Candidatus Thorarchaeota archaeon]|jgi:protein-S-isoprenylcysteine O-methyltransferase Ste14